jgi:sugar phosphate permease
MSIKTDTNDEEIKYFNWSKLIIISLTTVLTGIYRDGFSSIFPFLQSDFNLSRAQLGLHSTFFFFTSAIFAVFAGRLVDLKGSKWGLGFGLLLTGVLFALHSIIPSFTLILILSTITGFAVSINVPSASKSIIEWFPKTLRGTALGFLSAALPAGGILGALVLPFLSRSMGWRQAILFPSVFTVSYAFYILYFYKEKRLDNDHFKNNGVNKISLLKRFNKLFCNSELLSVSVFGFFLGATSASIAAHFTLFLYLDYNLPMNVAGMIFAIVQFGSFIGRIGWGIICDRLLKTNRRKTFLYTGFVFLFLSLIIYIFSDRYILPMNLILILSFFIGFSGRGWTGLYLVSAAETVNEDDIGISTGFSLLFMRMGAMSMPPVFGYIADINGTYSVSWILLGFMMFLTSLIQYTLSKKKSKNDCKK